jgi:hypothetical protein
MGLFKVLPKNLPVGVILSLAVTATTVAIWSSCGEDEFNVYQPVAEPLALKNDDDAKLEQARVLMDKKKYDEALKILEPMIGDSKQDSNEARILFSAAKLGVAQLDVWSIIGSILDSTSNSSGSSGDGGVDNIFDSFSDSVLGTGAARDAKVTALSDALEVLQAAPQPDERKLRNTACIFAGFLSVPTLADATTAMTNMQTALQQISNSALSGGTVCPDVSLLDDAAAGLANVAESFNMILSAAQSCPFLNLDEAANLMNTVEQSMNNLRTSADKGCDSLPTCPASLPGCRSLFPVCVQQALEVGTSSAKAQDGNLASCEIVLHCINPTDCF